MSSRTREEVFMNLVFEKAGEGDIPELTRVMTRAFDDDAQKHLGIEKGGPPGYDDGEFFRKWMLGLSIAARDGPPMVG
jgi:hypothetical protein